MTIARTPAPFAATVREAFAPSVIFLNAAGHGLTPKSVAAAVEAAERQRVTGEFDSVAVDSAVHACRVAFGELIGFEARQVAIGAQVSPLVGLVAESLPPGAKVIVPEGEFTSVRWPFLARRDLEVRTVPLRELADAVRPGDAVLAASVVQSADGSVLDVPAVVDAAHASGARVLLDVSQAAGWFPVRDTGADWIVSVGFKWLLGPKGTAFLAGTDAALDTLRPLAAGWYAGDNPWTSVYEPSLGLATDARRFDVSPVWSAWLGQVPALELVQSIGIENIRRHNVALTNRLRTGLGLPEGNSAIVSVAATPEALERLGAAGIVGAIRAGRLRLACHLYNTEADIDHTLDVLIG
ncbi:MAG: aminotransferase [Nocardia sp.]|uniref:aminotransferase class V-fold PLP-dependent enzyme n=1 Tax=Nocardia sp. TaxID=1821 RepID=UPI002607BF6B|nr:aminotransferase class V-fold PLP-dependent enzyme [Nocardia sp.]MCU1645096.1 aminotransferase [Nocardia sp.]